MQYGAESLFAPIYDCQCLPSKQLCGFIGTKVDDGPYNPVD
jgi:hypothetical protein